MTGRLVTPDGILEAADFTPWPFGWESLSWISLTDKRDAIRIYTRLGMHPILVHGTLDDGACTCPRWKRGECDKPGKHPVEAGWQKAPLDLAHLDEALARNHRFNIGLRMGVQPGGFKLVAIDVDGGRDLLEPLESKMGKLPPTLTSKSARGLHLLFKVKPTANIPNAVKLSVGVDVRSEGGQIVAPPSRHLSGARYTWLDCREPEALP